jgi:hypothetical protein
MLDPLELRTLINETGTPQQGTRLIGPRPNLEAAIDALLSSASAPEWRLSTRLDLVGAPNPFRGSSEVRFVAPAGGTGTLAVYDARGRLVRELLAGVMPPGEQIVTWDGRSDAGDPVPSGVYFYRLSMDAASGTTSVRRIR